MQMFKKGAVVRLVQPVIEGVIVGGKLADGGDNIDYVVAYLLPSGEVHERHFSSDELVAVAEAEQAALVERVAKAHAARAEILAAQDEFARANHPQEKPVEGGAA
jgi:hypothetical protein